MSVSLRPFLGLFFFLLLVPSLVTAQVDFSTSRSFGDSITANDNVHLYFPPELGLDPTKPLFVLKQSDFGPNPFKGDELIDN